MRTTVAALAFSSLAAFAPSALADGREPGSVLVYPFHRSALIESAVFNVVNVTNTNRAGSGETDVHFEYVNVSSSGTPFLFADCSISDRVETLTPADTLSVLTSCHNGAQQAEGYIVVSARNPNLVDTYWSFNHLVGSEQIVSVGGGIYGIDALPFVSPLAQGTDTDLDQDGKRDFDGNEYEGLPDELYIDSYIGVFPGSIVLLTFLGGEYLVNVNFIIYNDDEFQLSGQFAFSCWASKPLNAISGYFSSLGLSTTPNDSKELDTSCDGVEDFNTGWAIVRPTTAISITSPTIVNPPVLGAYRNDGGFPFNNARELWESPAKQFNGEFGS
jgi:hypothetical protein